MKPQPAGESRTAHYPQTPIKPQVAVSTTSSTYLSCTIFQHLSAGWMWCHQLLHQTQALRRSQNSKGSGVHVHYAKHVLIQLQKQPSWVYEITKTAVDGCIPGSMFYCSEPASQKEKKLLSPCFQTHSWSQVSKCLRALASQHTSSFSTYSHPISH